jgi:hypothetical protein
VFDVRLQGKAVCGVSVWLIVVIVMAFVLGMLIFAVVRFILMERALKRLFFEATARRFKGTYVPSGIVSGHRIEFLILGRPARVEFEPSGDDRSGRTTVRVQLRGPSPGTLHILQEGFAQEFLKLFGVQDISIGDTEFDKAWVVKATPESLAFRVFSPERRTRAIAAVRRLTGWGNPTIEVTRDQLRIQVRDEIRSEGGVVALVKSAQEFLEFLDVPSASTGIELGEVKTPRNSTCPVCGTTLKDPTVRCESCKTPHHSECWTYVGRCSTYACKGKRCVA